MYNAGNCLIKGKMFLIQYHLPYNKIERTCSHLNIIISSTNYHGQVMTRPNFIDQLKKQKRDQINNTGRNKNLQESSSSTAQTQYKP